MQNASDQALFEHLSKIREMVDAAMAMLRKERPSEAKPKKPVRHHGGQDSLDFTVPARAFFNTYARLLSGPEKFALVVAYLAKGDVTKLVPLSEIESVWSKTTTSLGAYNRAHPTRAKDRDLVDSPNKGSYQLRPNWRSIVQ